MLIFLFIIYSLGLIAMIGCLYWVGRVHQQGRTTPRRVLAATLILLSAIIIKISLMYVLVEKWLT